MGIAVAREKADPENTYIFFLTGEEMTVYNPVRTLIRVSVCGHYDLRSLAYSLVRSAFPSFTGHFVLSRLRSVLREEGSFGLQGELDCQWRELPPKNSRRKH